MSEEAEPFGISLQDLAEQNRTLTMDEVAKLFHNHSLAMTILERVIEQQDIQITTLMYTLAAYMKQYPLDLAKLSSGDESPISQPEPEHFKHPGAYL